MSNYKISGIVGEACDIRLMKGNSFLGYRESVSAGPYELIFTLDTIENVDVIAVRPDGKIVGYGNITPVDTVSDINTTMFLGNSISKVEECSVFLSAISPTAYTGTTTLSNSYDTSKSIIVERGISTGSGYGDHYDCLQALSATIKFNSSNEIQAERLNTGYMGYVQLDVTLHYTIIEFSGNVSVQHGISRTNSVVTNIEEVNISKSFLNVNGYTALYDDYRSLPTASLSSNTTVNSYSSVGNLNSGLKVSWQVVEFE